MATVSNKYKATDQSKLTNDVAAVSTKDATV